MSSATLLGALASVALHVATHPYGSTARHVTMQQAPPKFDADAFAAAAPPSTLSRTIAEYPDPALRAPCNDVAEFDASLAALCADCFAAMYASGGVGIAAPQLGVPARLFVYNTDPTAPGGLDKLGERVVANPKILKYSEATEVGVEGSLSLRAECCGGDVCRAASIEVEYQDEKGEEHRKTLRGFEAAVFQHKYDHTVGVLHVDRLSAADRAKVQPYLDALVEVYGEGGALEPEARVEKRMKPPPLSTVKSRKEAAKRNRVGGGKKAAKGKARTAAGAGGFGSKGKRK